MITTRFIRIASAVVVVALLAVIVLEVHWSMDAKSEARTVAATAAFAGAREMATSHDSLKARHEAETVAVAGRTHLIAFTIGETGGVSVTVNRRAKSYILRRVPPTRSLSEITVTVTAAPQ